MFEIPNVVAAQRKIRPKSTRFPRLMTRRRSPAAEKYLVSPRAAAAAAQTPHSSSPSLQVLANCLHLSVAMKFSYAASAILGALAAASGADAASFNRIATVSRPSRGFGACAIWLICAAYLHCAVACSGAEPWDFAYLRQKSQLLTHISTFSSCNLYSRLFFIQQWYVCSKIDPTCNSKCRSPCDERFDAMSVC